MSSPFFTITGIGSFWGKGLFKVHPEGNRRAEKTIFKGYTWELKTLHFPASTPNTLMFGSCGNCIPSKKRPILCSLPDLANSRWRIVFFSAALTFYALIKVERFKSFYLRSKENRMSSVAIGDCLSPVSISSSYIS